MLVFSAPILEGLGHQLTLNPALAVFAAVLLLGSQYCIAPSVKGHDPGENSVIPL